MKKVTHQTGVKKFLLFNFLIPRNPPVYRIKDLNDENVEGIFYESELQKVIKQDDILRIDQVLKKKTKNR